MAPPHSGLPHRTTNNQTFQNPHPQGFNVLAIREIKAENLVGLPFNFSFSFSFSSFYFWILAVFREPLFPFRNHLTPPLCPFKEYFFFVCSNWVWCLFWIAIDYLNFGFINSRIPAFRNLGGDLSFSKVPVRFLGRI